MIGRNGWKADVLPIFRQTLNVYFDGASYPCFQHLLDGGRGVVACLVHGLRMDMIGCAGANGK